MQFGLKIIVLSVHFFWGGGAKNSVAIERKFGDPKMHPKSNNWVKIEVKIKKNVFLVADFRRCRASVRRPSKRAPGPGKLCRANLAATRFRTFDPVLTAN